MQDSHVSMTVKLSPNEKNIPNFCLYHDTHIKYTNIDSCSKEYVTYKLRFVTWELIARINFVRWLKKLKQLTL